MLDYVAGINTPLQADIGAIAYAVHRFQRGYCAHPHILDYKSGKHAHPHTYTGATAYVVHFF